MASQVHIQRTLFMQQEVGLNCQLKRRSSRSPLTKSRVESREGSKVESINRVDRQLSWIDRVARLDRFRGLLSTRNISSKSFLSNLANRQTDRQTERQMNAGINAFAYIRPQNCAFSDIFGPDLTRRAAALCMGIAICHRRKLGQVWGHQLPYQKSQAISGAGRHPLLDLRLPHGKIGIILRCNPWAVA